MNQPHFIKIMTIKYCTKKKNHSYDFKLNKISKSIFKRNRLASFNFIFDLYSLFEGDEKVCVY